MMLAGADIDESELVILRSNAALVMTKSAKLRGKPLSFDRESVAWLEGFSERIRERDPVTAGRLLSTFGSFLGGAIVEATGGCWRRGEESRLGVQFRNGSWCFPFSAMEKQLTYGLEHSIASFYDISVDFVATGELGAPQEGSR